MLEITGTDGRQKVMIGCEHLDAAYQKFIVPIIDEKGINSYGSFSGPKYYLMSSFNRQLISAFLSPCGYSYKVGAFSFGSEEFYYCHACMVSKYGFSLDICGTKKLFSTSAVSCLYGTQKNKLGCCRKVTKSFNSFSKSVVMMKIKESDTLHSCSKRDSLEPERLVSDVIYSERLIRRTMRRSLDVCDDCVREGAYV